MYITLLGNPDDVYDTTKNINLNVEVGFDDDDKMFIRKQEPMMYSFNEEHFQNITNLYNSKMMSRLQSLFSYPIAAIYRKRTEVEKKASTRVGPHYKRVDIYIRAYREKLSEWDSGYSDYKIEYDLNTLANEYHVYSITQITIDDKHYRNITESVDKTFFDKVNHSLLSYCIEQDITPIFIQSIYMKLNEREDLSNKRTIFYMDYRKPIDEHDPKRQRRYYMDGRSRIKKTKRKSVRKTKKKSPRKKKNRRKSPKKMS